MKKITIAQSKRIARGVIRYANSVGYSRSIDFNAQIDGHLSEIGLGWILKSGTYIDGLDCQFIGALSKTIRANAISIY
jgi:hypothetical protein